MPEATTVRVILHDQLTGQYGTLDLPVAQLPRLAGATLQLCLVSGFWLVKGLGVGTIGTLP